MKTQIFYKVNYDLKGHPRSNNTFMPKSFKHIRWTDFDKNLTYVLWTTFVLVFVQMTFKMCTSNKLNMHIKFELKKKS